MLEPRGRLEADVRDGVEALRRAADGRYACLVERAGILFETPEPGDGKAWTLRRVLEANLPSLFALPPAMADERPEVDAADPFADWEEDEFYLAFLNGKVALVIACPDAEAARAELERPLRALVDRLLRWRPDLRIDARGRGLFFGRPRLDVIVVGGATTDS